VYADTSSLTIMSYPACFQCHYNETQGAPLALRFAFLSHLVCILHFNNDFQSNLILCHLANMWRRSRAPCSCPTCVSEELREKFRSLRVDVRRTRKSEQTLGSENFNGKTRGCGTNWLICRPNCTSKNFGTIKNLQLHFEEST
jgi:hypothetical protein